MNMRQVEIFAAVMRAGTASSAAELLNISQPSVSKLLSDLERSVGFALFERVRGRLVPTPEGRMFEREVDKAFAGLSQLRSAAARIREVGSGEVRIGCLGALIHTVVPLGLQDFRRAFPEVPLVLQSRLSRDIRDLVASGELHLGLVANEVDTTGLFSRRFSSFPAVVALYPGHPLEQRTSIAPADLHNQEFITLAPKDTVRVRVEAELAAAGASPKTIIETPLSTTVCELVAARLGCGIVNPITAQRFPELRLKPFTPRIDFNAILVSTSEQLSRPLSALVAALDAAVAQLGGKPPC